MTTKLELTQLLAERNAQLEAARLRISTLEGDVTMWQSKFARAEQARLEHAVRVLPAPLRVVRQPHALPAHFAAARDAAMRTGTTIKVTA